MGTLLGYPMGKKKKGREIERYKISKNLKYERLALSHLLGYFPGMPYGQKEKRERDRER